MKIKESILVMIISIAICVVLCGCCGKGTDEKLCAQVLPSIVEIQVRDEEEQIVGNATGTVISEDGNILTNRHVVRKYDYETNSYILYSKIYVRFYNQTDFIRSEVVIVSENSDLALLKIDTTDGNFISLAKTEKLNYGETVHSIGNGNGYGLSYSKGSVAAPLRHIEYDGKTVDAIQINMNVYEGNSGGALLNQSGELVGIITFRLRDNKNEIIHGTAFALPLNTIKEFLGIISN